jgi:transposase
MPRTNLQKTDDFDGQIFYLGLDVHKKSWAITIRSLGIEVSHFTQPPGVEALSNYLKREFPGGTYHSAYEAGFCGTGTHEQLCKLGIKNILVHAADIPSTDKQKKNKTDLHDSRAIAGHLERGNLHGIYVLTQEQQELRSLFRLRESKVNDVTRANNRLKSFLMYYSIRLPETVSKNEFLSSKALAWLSIELGCAAGTFALQQYIEDLKYQRQQLFHITKSLRVQVQTLHEKTYKNLLSVPGIGAITAMGLIAEVADFKRFNDPDEYCSYLGLCPWEDSSGDTIKTKGVQPRCNSHLRPLLVEASWQAIRKSRTLFAYYSKHTGKSGKKAIIKVARKLALIAKGVATTGRLYQEDYLKKKQQEQQIKKQLKAERFSSGITEQHINDQPDDRLQIATMPG